MCEVKIIYKSVGAKIWIRSNVMWMSICADSCPVVSRHKVALSPTILDTQT